MYGYHFLVYISLFLIVTSHYLSECLKEVKEEVAAKLFDFLLEKLKLLPQNNLKHCLELSMEGQSQERKTFLLAM